MNETINGIISVAAGVWYHLPLGVLILGLTFGFAPGLVLNLSVLIYPKGHPRRKELVAELHEVPYFQRALWVFYALQLSITEGIPERWRWAFAQLRDRRENMQKKAAFEMGVIVVEVRSSVDPPSGEWTDCFFRSVLDRRGKRLLKRSKLPLLLILTELNKPGMLGRAMQKLAD